MFCAQVVRILVGNKDDNSLTPGQKVVSSADARAFAQDIGVEFFETSAKDNKNVDEVRAVLVIVHMYCGQRVQHQFITSLSYQHPPTRTVPTLPIGRD